MEDNHKKDDAIFSFILPVEESDGSDDDEGTSSSSTQQEERCCPSSSLSSLRWQQDGFSASVGFFPNSNSNISANEEDLVKSEVHQHSLREDQAIEKPGAHAIPGVISRPSFASSESSGQEGTENVAAQPSVLFVAQNAQLIDEAAEEQRRQKLEQRNIELESRIQQIEQDAVDAIPVLPEDTDRPMSPRCQRACTLAYCFQNKWTRWCFAGFLIVVAAVTIVMVLVMAFRNGDDPLKWNQLGQTLYGYGIEDYFGYSVALAADGMSLAASGFADKGNGPYAGYVKVFSYESGSQLWKQHGQDVHGKAEEDELGESLALSSDGSVMAVGAMTDRDRIGYIQVHAFNSDAGNWSQVGHDVEGRAFGDYFGSSITLSSDGAVVAAGGPGRYPLDVGNYTGNQTGYVRVLTFNSTTSLWTRMGQDFNGTGIGDAFGRSVALSANGMVLAAGAEWSDGDEPDAGRVQVFTYNGNHWEQKGQDLVGKGANGRFGKAVALSEDGNIVAVGAVWTDGTSVRRSGHVRVFSYDSGSNLWHQIGHDIDGESEGDQFGVSVALSSDGMIAAIGANYNDGNGKRDSGHVQVFSYESKTDGWKQVGENIEGEGEYDEFGLSVALSSDGTIVASGAQHNNQNGQSSGLARVFQKRENSN